MTAVAGSVDAVAVADEDEVQAFAAATLDDCTRYLRAGLTPPFFAARLAAPVIGKALRRVVPDLASPVLHVAQEVEFHAPLPIGNPVTIRGRVAGMADFGFAPAVVVEATIRAADGPLSVTSRSTMLLPDEPRTGRAVPRQPKVFGTERLGGLRLRLPVDLPARYADASGDHNPIHVDPAAAAAAGLPGVVVHGMCTMAVAWAAVDRAVAYPGPGRLARAATRFSRPVLPGEDLTLEVFRTSQERTLRADVAQRGHAVLKDLTFSLHSLEPA